MRQGTLYGVGVGPGDPELVTVKGARLISECPHLFAPKARMKSTSVALEIARPYLAENTKVHELVFPMITDKALLEKNWADCARQIADALGQGQDACFITLGDPFLYSTYIYLLRALQKIAPDAPVVTAPGITAFCHASALTRFAVGEGKKPVTIVPTSDDMEQVRRAVRAEGSVVLMKIGKRLQQILETLEDMGVIDDAVFVSNAGMENQRIETDLRKLKNADEKTGYLSIILLNTGGSGK